MTSKAVPPTKALEPVLDPLAQALQLHLESRMYPCIGCAAFPLLLDLAHLTCGVGFRFDTGFGSGSRFLFRFRWKRL